VYPLCKSAIRGVRKVIIVPEVGFYRTGSVDINSVGRVAPSDVLQSTICGMSKCLDSIERDVTES
jgi:hypothetical protein